MERTNRKKTLSKYVGRAVLLSFGAGTVVMAVLMMVSGGMLAAKGTGTYEISLGPLMFFQAAKENHEGGGTTAEISPGFGVFVLLVIIPLAAGTVTYFVKKRSARKAGN